MRLLREEHYSFPSAAARIQGRRRGSRDNRNGKETSAIVDARAGEASVSGHCAMDGVLCQNRTVDGVRRRRRNGSNHVRRIVILEADVYAQFCEMLFDFVP